MPRSPNTSSACPAERPSAGRHGSSAIGRTHARAKKSSAVCARDEMEEGGALGWGGTSEALVHGAHLVGPRHHRVRDGESRAPRCVEQQHHPETRSHAVGETRRFAHPNAHFASHADVFVSLTVRNLRESQCRNSYVYKYMFTQDPNPTSATTRNRGQGETCRFGHLTCEVATLFLPMGTCQRLPVQGVGTLFLSALFSSHSRHARRVDTRKLFSDRGARR